MYFEDFELNQQFAIPPAHIGKSQIKAFARDYDPLPLHLDEEKARETRFGGLIAPGVMSFMSVWAEFVRLDIINARLVAGLSTKIEWFAPVYPGDELSGTATITKKEDYSEDSGFMELSIEVHNQEGLLVLKDVTEILMQRRPEP